MKKGTSREKVPAITIDGIVKDNNINKLDMISLTLNGAELEALRGAEDTLRRFKPRLRMPGFASLDGIPLWKRNSDFLEMIGYRTFITPRGNILAIP